jgi:hypothetical protein
MASSSGREGCEWQRGEMVERRERATREGSMRRDDIATVCVREREPERSGETPQLGLGLFERERALE